jgi:hypothetical protein
MTDDTGVRAKRMPQKLEATIDHLGKCIEDLRQTHEISKTCNLDRVVTAANGLYGHRLEVLAKIAEVFEKLDNGEGGDARDLLDDYIAEAELAAQLGIKPRTLQLWRLAGRGPAPTIIAKKILYRRSTVAQWLEDQERKPERRRRTG